MDVKLLAVVGPSCAGKDTLADKLVHTHPELVQPIYRTTTRPRRYNEMYSSQYEFITEKQFLQDMRWRKFAEATRYRGWYYGTRISNILPGKICVAAMDIKALAQIKQNCPGLGLRVAYVDAPLKVRIRRYKSREGKATFEMYRRMIADGWAYRHALEDIRKLGVAYTYLPNTMGLYAKVSQTVAFCNDWNRRAIF